MAACQVVCQIYYYRLRTDSYDVSAPTPEGEEELSPKEKIMKARGDFVRICGEIYGNAISTEVAKGGYAAEPRS